MKDIFKRICYAQITSDGGKGITELKKFNNKTWQQGYAAKDREILRALELIKNGKGYNVKYSISWDYYSKSLHRDCYIVYFTWIENGVRKQVSFHTFEERVGDFYNDQHVTRWHKQMSSRDTVRHILEKND